MPRSGAEGEGGVDFFPSMLVMSTVYLPTPAWGKTMFHGTHGTHPEHRSRCYNLEVPRVKTRIDLHTIESELIPTFEWLSPETSGIFLGPQRADIA